MKPKIPIVIVNAKLCQSLSFVVPISGFTFFPVILLAQKPDLITLNHESIHVQQQKELLLVGFYLLYVVFWLLGLARGESSALAYSRIPFEQESYLFEKDLTYLSTRRWYAWARLAWPR